MDKYSLSPNVHFRSNYSQPGDVTSNKFQLIPPNVFSQSVTYEHLLTPEMLSPSGFSTEYITARPLSKWNDNNLMSFANGEDINLKGSGDGFERERYIKLLTPTMISGNYEMDDRLLTPAMFISGDKKLLTPEMMKAGPDDENIKLLTPAFLCEGFHMVKAQGSAKHSDHKVIGDKGEDLVHKVKSSDKAIKNDCKPLEHDPETIVKNSNTCLQAGDSPEVNAFQVEPADKNQPIKDSTAAVNQFGGCKEADLKQLSITDSHCYDSQEPKPKNQANTSEPLADPSISVFDLDEMFLLLDRSLYINEPFSDSLEGNCEEFEEIFEDQDELDTWDMDIPDCWQGYYMD